MKGVTGLDLSNTAEWYRDKYIECAAWHNGLVDAIQQPR